MRSISKAERCVLGAKKCINNAATYIVCTFLAPTPYDSELCVRKYRRAIRHANRYIELVEYYGGD